jgi:hypothetical protein
MRVAVQGGSTFRVGNQVRLFEGPYFTTPTQAGRTYDISRDGQRFLMIKVGDGSDQAATPPSIGVVQNWQEELKRLVTTR